MKINKIKICNISSYAGECAFDFSVNKDKTIVLIGGQNGTGKTSLFTALKLALYGHLCFNYQSNNSQYLSKIKELINHDAFTSTEVRAFVEVEIEIPNERELVKYSITRTWEYSTQKLNEEVFVCCNGIKLKHDEIIFFQNYLFTVVPPNLFDFFFFDGEQIADFFATNNYNTYIKNALLTLCSFDTFELIRKFCDNYVSTGNVSDISDETTYKYEKIKYEINGLNGQIAERSWEIGRLESSLNEVYENKDDLENLFKNAGGLTDEEKEELLKESRENEKIKNVSNVYTKSFAENMMPFIIAQDISVNIKEQLCKEDDVKKYFALQEKLNSTKIVDVIKSTMNKFNMENDNLTFINELTNAISSAVKPNVNVDEFEFLHDLSKEQQEKVDSILRYIEKFKKNSIIKKIDSKEKATLKTTAINKSLRDAMSDIDTESYSVRFNELTNSEFELKKQLEITTLEQKKAAELLEEMKVKHASLLEELKTLAKNRNVYSLTEKVSGIMNSMIDELTIDKFKQIEVSMLSMLKSILRKDNFIDLVELDENFNIYLYKEQLYQLNELENLISNIGYDELAKRIGNTGVEKLMKALDIDLASDIKKHIKKQGNQVGLFINNNIDLYKKIEFGQLSKGEKQIFILSLYYSIIKVSGKDIPFIIDTPYARIDTEHREQISKEFFPNISNQVIILSTDEEISKTYYDVIKPFISKEYLLQYNELESKTTVSDGYFFKG